MLEVMNRMFRRLSIILHLIIKLSVKGFFFSVCFGFGSSILRWTNEKKLKMRATHAPKLETITESNKNIGMLMMSVGTDVVDESVSESVDDDDTDG